MLLYHLNSHHRMIGCLSALLTDFSAWQRSDSPMVSWQMHNQMTMQKVHFVQWHKVAVQTLHVVVVAAVAAAELPQTIVCFVIPIWLRLAWIMWHKTSTYRSLKNSAFLIVSLYEFLHKKCCRFLVECLQSHDLVYHTQRQGAQCSRDHGAWKVRQKFQCLSLSNDASWPMTETESSCWINASDWPTE